MDSDATLSLKLPQYYAYNQKGEYKLKQAYEYEA